MAEAERIHAEHAPTVDGRKIPLAVIPSAQGPRERPSAERIAAHRAFLLELARQSHDPATPAEDRPETIVWEGELPESMNTRIGQLCTLCEGHCCHMGGNHAFLTAGTLRRVRLQQADVTDEELVAQYLSYLPEEIVEYSCIYHASTGCALPREMRSDTSRNYFCPSLVDAMKLMAGGEEQLFAVAVSESAVERTGIVR